MNGYQRIRAVLNGEWPDKRPVMLHNFMMAAREAGLTMKEYRKNPDKAAKAHIQAVEEKVNKLLDIYKNSPRLIVNAGCAIPPDTPSENIERLIEVTRSF